MAAEAQQQIVGDRGIGVQIGGDSNTVIVYAGSAELHLTRKHLREAEPKTELQLLRVDLRATTLVGRDRDLSALKTWLASDQRLISVRALTARAGAGKTRLAIELCEHAERDGWTAGFAQYDQFREFAKRAAEWCWDKPTLVVVDYAAALARDLRAWLEILARPEAQTGVKKLRLLLLERHAERDLGWWADLMRTASFSDPAPDELADPPEPVPLLSLSAVKDRRSLLVEAMRRAGHIAGIHPIPGPPPLGANADFDRRLADDTINNEPLYLMMAGAEAIHTGASAALTLTRTDLAERAASRERERLNRLALQWRLSDKLVAHLAMCVTLQGGCNAEEALQLVNEEQRAMGFPEIGPAADLVNRLSEALPMPGGAAVDAVRPDLIGEAFLLHGMQEHRLFPRVQTEIVERAWRRAERKVGGTLIRTAQDYARGDANHCSVAWLRHLIDRTVDLGTLMVLANDLPEHTLALRELAARTSERIGNMLIESGTDEAELPLLATARNNLAIRLSDLGRSEPALAAAEEAVTIYRKLAAQRPDAFGPNFAGSLNNLAATLSAFGRREEALAAAEEAVAIRRELAAQRPDAFQPDLATTVNNLANMLSDLGRREEALAAAEEAVAIRRELAAQRLDAFGPDLATSLSNLANMLSALGRREPARAAAEEAAALYREMATQRPDAFRPNLATSLNNLAAILSDFGQHEPAVAAVEEAIAIRRELAAQRPDAFRPDLATSLGNLAIMLSALGQREPARAAAEEAVAIRRELAAQRPAALRPDLAVSLNTLANMLSDLGRREEALAAAEEAVALQRSLAAQRPDVFQPDLAASVNNLAAVLSALGRREEARAAAEEAVAIRRELAAQRPDAFRHKLGGSLNNLAAMLSDLGQRELARAAAEEAVAIRRELATQRPDTFRPDLAMSLNNLATMLSDLRRPEEALAAAEEAVAIRRELAAQRPEAFQPDLAASLAVQADCLDALGHAADAFTTNIEAVTTLCPAFVEHPAAFHRWMGPMVRQCLERCQRLGRAPNMELLGPIIAILQKNKPRKLRSGQMSIELAAAAVAFLTPYLAEAGKEAAKTVGKETAGAGIKLLGWMRQKLTGRAKEALSELEEKPDSQLNQDDLRTQLAKLLEKQPELEPQLRELLSEAQTQGDVMSQAVGASSKASQIKGDRNKVSIS